MSSCVVLNLATSSFYLKNRTYLKEDLAVGGLISSVIAKPSWNTLEILSLPLPIQALTLDTL